MADMFEATAKYLERKDEFRKNVRSALVMPSITLLCTIAAFVWYIWSLIPQMMGLFTQFEIDVPFLTRTSLAFASWMDHNYWWVIFLSVALVAGFIIFARTDRGRFLIHKYMLRIPLLGPLLHKLNLEVFCRVFGVLYGGSGDNEETMKVAAEATGNTYVEHQVRTITIPLMMARGTDLIQAMQSSGVFLPMLIARFRSGAETGSIRESADEMADLYEGETKLKLEMVVEGIKIGIAFFISFVVGILTVISMETAFMMPSGSEIMLQAK
jgi:type IV pilus assembly protein PilC